ncbi:MAG: hypothetical protein JSR77_02025 [Planctomycetes bacterium]|nr:hypothetical protein [Planctomycetota bacterium]
MSTTQAVSTPTYDQYRAAHQQIVKVLMPRMPKAVRDAALRVLCVPVVNGRPVLKRKETLDNVLEFAFVGLLRTGRNYAAQSLTERWPATPVERAALTAAGNARYLFGKFTDIKAGEGVEVEDFHGHKTFIADRQMSNNAKIGLGMAGFVMQLPGVTMLSGSPFLVNWEVLGPRLAEAAKGGILPSLDQPLDGVKREKHMGFVASFISTVLNE